MSGQTPVYRTEFHTDDVQELRERSLGWDLDYAQMVPGPFHGGVFWTSIGPRQIYREYWDKKIRYQGTAPTGSVALGLPLKDTGLAHWVGLPAGPNAIILQAPDREADLISAACFDTLVLSASQEECGRILSTLSGWGEGLLSRHGVVPLTPDVAESLRYFGRDFIHHAADEADMDLGQMDRYSLQLLRLFLWELLEAQPDLQSEAAPPLPSRIVRTATDIALADRDSTMGLAEICGQLGVSLRALHYAFTDITGLTPATWLRRLRLNRVHQTLLHAAPEEVLVKQVAIQHGFLHAGHFSRQYRRLFGCRPSDTLRKVYTPHRANGRRV